MSNSKESGGELELIQVECTELEKVLKVLQARAKALKLNNGGEEIEIVEQMSVETVEGASNKELNEGASNVQPQVDSPAVKIFKDFIEELADVKKIRIKKYRMYSEQISSGAFGNVYGGYENISKKYFAIKIIPITERRSMEGEIMLQLTHPNIIHLHERFVYRKSIYLIMELAEYNLLNLREVSSLELDEMLDIALNAAQGLEYIHSKLIVHADIKSLNMLICNGVLKICDFGEASHLPVPAGKRGTSIYTAPELIRHNWASEYFSTKCDVWSFGIMIIELLDRSVPFLSRFSQDRNAFYNFVRSAEYEAPDFAPEGPKWHQQIFGPILAGALQLRPGMRSSAAELLELIKELDTENKQRKVYAAKLESANQLRDKLKNEIKKLQEAMMEETMVEDQKNFEETLTNLLLETDSVQLTYKFEHYYTILQLSVIIQLNNLSRGEFPVISVRRRADGKRFALKMMLADKCAAMEAEMMRGLDHYNILQLETDFVKDNNHYLVLERCQQNMTEFKETPLYDADSMFHFASSILQGLVFLDTMKICHLDLKAENLLYSESGGILNFRICDFGAAERLPFLGGMRGTAHWMAPEIIRGFWAGQDYGHKNDLWSFGIALMEILQGHAPDHELSELEFFKKVRDPGFTAPELQAPLESWEQIYFGQLMAQVLIVNPNRRMDAISAHISVMSLKFDYIKKNVNVPEKAA